MTKNKNRHLKDYIYVLGVPARSASPVALYAATPQALAMGLMVADSSFLRSLCRSLCPKTPAFAGFTLQSLTQIDFCSFVFLIQYYYNNSII